MLLIKKYAKAKSIAVSYKKCIKGIQNMSIVLRVFDLLQKILRLTGNNHAIAKYSFDAYKKYEKAKSRNVSYKMICLSETQIISIVYRISNCL